MKKSGLPHLTEWEKRKLREEFTRFFLAYDLEYLIMVKN